MTLIPEIDTFACVAHGDCAVVAPDAFRVDDVAVVIGSAPEDRLREAARACPAGAIVLIDDVTGEEVGSGVGEPALSGLTGERQPPPQPTAAATTHPKRRSRLQ
jgi:ferredoxin